MNNIALHIYPSTFEHETRILKETRSLVQFDLFDKIFIVALWKNGLKKHERLDDKRELWRVPIKTAFLPNNTFCKIIKHIEWTFRIFFKFKNISIKFINCHNLSSLSIGILFKKFLNSKIIYDAHELETERNGWSQTKKRIAKILEKYLIYHTDAIIVVSQSISQWYKINYSLKNIHVVYNFPCKHKQKNINKKFNILKEKFNIKNDEILFIYQGLLGGGRSINLLLNIFSDINKKKHIVFMGYGPLAKKIKKFSKKFSNIHLHPAVRMKDITYYTQSADVGLSLIENTCLSYYLTLANKVVEYINAGIPVITTDFPEPKKIIENYKCGWTIREDKTLITDFLKNISLENIKDKTNNASKHKNVFVWENEEKKMIKIYKNLIK